MDEVIKDGSSRISFDAVRRAEINIRRGDEVLQIDKADLRELVGLAHWALDRIKDQSHD